MRLAATGLALAVAFAVGAPIYVVRTLRDSEPAQMFDFHPPKTAREHAAATLTLDFVQAMQRHDAKAACRLADEQAAQVLHCAGAHPRVKDCGTHVYAAEEEGADTVAVTVAFCAFRV